MTDADAFLDAIFADPENDLPRLVYAEFIRLQCAIARLPGNSPEVTELWKRVQPVWARLEDEWWPATREAWVVGCALRYGVQPYEISEHLDAVHFRRGLLDKRVRIPFDRLIRFTHLWSWLPPPACTLRLDYPIADEAAACRTLSRVRDLRLDHEDDLLDPGLIRFLESPHLKRLKTLDLSVPVTRRVIDDLIRLPNLAGVDDVRIVLVEDDGYDPEAECIRLRGRFPRVTVVQANGP